MTTSIRSHAFREGSIPPSAVEIIERLNEFGHQAYLVGGCVRDLLLGRTPKDFDIATGATPDEITAVFPNCRLVGRRFQIAHVRADTRFHEVATFRRESVDEDFLQDDEDESAELGEAPLDHDWIDNNVYGTIEQDTFRRDFTINALYYDPLKGEVIDRCGGLNDIETQTLRVIGDPDERFLEDPARLIRGIRIAGRLGLQIDPECDRSIAQNRFRILEVSRSRLFDEVAKLFLCGSAKDAYAMLSDYGLTEVLFPSVHSMDELTLAAFHSTDTRIEIGKPVTPAFVLAAMLWPQFQDATVNSSEDLSPFERHSRAAKAVLQELRDVMTLARRHAYFIEDTWILQNRLESRHFRSIQRLLEHRRFRAAYDLLVLRSQHNESLIEIADWWTQIQEVDDDERNRMIRGISPRRNRRHRRPRHPRPSAA